MSGPILLVDVGNSRIKWALVQPPQEWLAEGACAHGETARLLDEWGRFPQPASVVACNVAGDDLQQPLSAYWQSRKVPLHWVRASDRSHAGVSNLYERPQQLGSDRWAALIGAWQRARSACLVVSAGTAVTIDSLNERGEFIGGMILPGRLLMQQSLARGTHALKDFAGNPVELPRNTADAVSSGIATALACTVQAAYQRLAAAGATPPACIVTGGDAEWLSGQLQFGAIIAPRLILEGLLIMAQENAGK